MSWGKNYTIYSVFNLFFCPFDPFQGLFGPFLPCLMHKHHFFICGWNFPPFPLSVSTSSQQGSQDSTICASLARGHPNGSRVVTMSLTLFLPQDSWFTAFIVIIDIADFRFFITMELNINAISVAKMRLIVAQRTTTISLTSSWWSSWQRWCWLGCEGTTAACCADLLWRLNRLQIWSAPL